MADATNIFDFVAADEAATLRCAGWLAALMPPAALVFLEGDLGTGKTAFARGLIRALHGQETQVPSPTFTLVQPYDGPPDILHADLYRLGAADEIEELGVLDALDSHICLIEWAEKAADLLPDADMRIKLETLEGEARHLRLMAAPDIIDGVSRLAARDKALAAFLTSSDWCNAQRAPLAGDASTRRYERLSLGKKSAVLMDWAAAPDGAAIYDGQAYSQVAQLAEAMPRFADMVEWLAAHDLPVPQLHACDRDNGFAVLEDFGDRIITRDETIDRQVFYYEAVENLLHLHQQAAADFLPSYDGTVQAVEASLFSDWYLPFCGVQLSDAARADWQAIWQDLGNKLSVETPVTVLRDYHSVNLIWREGKQARYRLGLIDVQDALQGHAAYDVASLVYDARLDVTTDQQQAMLAHYRHKRFADDETARARFDNALAICAVQRNLKIAGIFVRLAERDGKRTYLRHLPRILNYIRTHIDNPTLAPAADWLSTHAPMALQPGDK